MAASAEDVAERSRKKQARSRQTQKLASGPANLHGGPFAVGQGTGALRPQAFWTSDSECKTGAARSTSAGCPSTGPA